MCPWYHSSFHRAAFKYQNHLNSHPPTSIEQNIEYLKMIRNMNRSMWLFAFVFYLFDSAKGELATKCISMINGTLSAYNAGLPCGISTPTSVRILTRLARALIAYDDIGIQDLLQSWRERMFDRGHLPIARYYRRRNSRRSYGL